MVAPSLESSFDIFDLLLVLDSLVLEPFLPNLASQPAYVHSRPPLGFIGRRVDRRAGPYLHLVPFEPGLLSPEMESATTPLPLRAHFSNRLKDVSPVLLQQW